MQQLKDAHGTIGELRREIGELVLANTKAAAREIVLLKMIADLEARLEKRILLIEQNNGST